MFAKSDLQFLTHILAKNRIMTSVARYDDPIGDIIDEGTARLFDTVGLKSRTLRDFLGCIAENTLYRMNRSIEVEFVYMLLPDGTGRNILLIGPYSKKQYNFESAIELAEKLGIDPKLHKLFQNYLVSLPTVLNNSAIHTVIETFAEHMWGAGNYSVLNVNQSEDEDLSFISVSEDADERSVMASMKLFEERYHNENEMMRYVSEGQSAKIDMIISRFSPIYFEKRVADTMRNAKNYCIITNTLLRKAAERGGVHPFNIDKTSTVFALRIEKCSTLNECSELIREMFKSYCRLVNKFATAGISPTVQKSIMIIDAGLSGELSLSGVAGQLNVSAGYLSSIFKKETGKTFTAYVTDKRIKHAAYLLSSTHLQIQTVAQNCGIADVQYFSKVFKSTVGKTPRAYRLEQKSKQKLTN